MISDRQRISHMLKAIEKIFEATACSHEDFMISLLRQDAVAYNFLILGEAAGRMSPEVYRIHPEIPWKLMTGMRNVLIHDYVQTNYQLVWTSAKRDLPVLYDQLKKMLPNE
jgi:hypothetical protein